MPALTAHEKPKEASQKSLKLSKTAIKCNANFPLEHKQQQQQDNHAWQFH